MEIFVGEVSATSPSSSSTSTSLAIPERSERNQTSSAPSSPTKGPNLFGDFHGKDSGSGKTSRSVKFPEDHFIVTGYSEAPDPFGNVDSEEEENQDLEAISEAFIDACHKHNVEPMSVVLEQIKNFKSIRVRAQDLILRGQKLSAHQCEALEEILKRVLFRLIDLDSCDLDCDGASALFDMIEFYESASHLSIANNKSIGVIGWQALCRTLKKTSCLQYLDLSNTGLNEQILLFMGRTIRVGSHLVVLHLENAGLFGRRLAILVSSIKFNTSLRELYLAENKISSADCVQIGNLLRGNSFLNVLDLRNNFIQDTGLDHICEGLSHQPTATGTAGLFGLFNPTHHNKMAQSNSPMSQNVGILVLNMSNNQFTSRGMNKLSMTLSHCKSLIGLDLSHNSIGDEGLFILKEGLLQCHTLKYLNLCATDLTNEGAKILSDLIRMQHSLTILDMSNNDIDSDGLESIRNAVIVNRNLTRLITTPQNNIPDESIVSTALEVIDSRCNRNRVEAKLDDYDSILNGFLQSDISVYQEMTDTGDQKENEFPTCDSSMDESSNELTAAQEMEIRATKKGLLARTASLGSWERPVKSGRFSVSPVDNQPTTPDQDSNNNPAIPIQIQVNPSEDSAPRFASPIQERGEEDENDGSDLSEQEMDQLPELPTCFNKKSNRLKPPSRGFRRMSSPAISITGVVKPPKPKANLSLKLSGNLESLDLKSSLPLSPTFFAKFDFSDLSLLRLPADVEEIISQIDHSVSDDLIFQFEKFSFEKPSKKGAGGRTHQQEQCVY